MLKINTLFINPEDKIQLVLFDISKYLNFYLNSVEFEHSNFSSQNIQEFFYVEFHKYIHITLLF